MIHTASMTSLTPDGGFVILFTIVMSFCLSVSKAAMAAFSAGMATANFSSHSSYETYMENMQLPVYDTTTTRMSYSNYT